MTVNSTDVSVLRLCVWYRKCVQVPLAGWLSWAPRLWSLGWSEKE